MSGLRFCMKWILFLRLYKVQDDPRIHDYNIDYYVNMFITKAKEQALHTRSNHIMWAMGSDFNYQNADHWLGIMA